MQTRRGWNECGTRKKAYIMAIEKLMKLNPTQPTPVTPVGFVVWSRVLLESAMASVRPAISYACWVHMHLVIGTLATFFKRRSRLRDFIQNVLHVLPLDVPFKRYDRYDKPLPGTLCVCLCDTVVLRGSLVGYFVVKFVLCILCPSLCLLA